VRSEYLARVLPDDGISLRIRRAPISAALTRELNGVRGRRMCSVREFNRLAFDERWWAYSKAALLARLCSEFLPVRNLAFLDMSALGYSRKAATRVRVSFPDDS
jgi:hypothetical protein